MGVAVLVREAKETDADELARLRWDFRVEDQRRQSQPAFRTAFKQWFASVRGSNRWIVIVAENGSKTLCGCMYLQCVEKVPSPGTSRREWGYVTNCYVDAEHRGVGIGTKMIRLLVDLARDRKLEFLTVWPSEMSLSFYKRAGFQSLSEIQLSADDEPPLELML